MVEKERENCQKWVGERQGDEQPGEEAGLHRLRDFYVSKELAKFKRQAEVAHSLIRLYHKTVCLDSVTLDLLEMQRFH